MKLTKPIFVLAGKTLSGKTTLLNYLIDECHMTNHKKVEKVVTITTRPKRPGEMNGKDYYFITNDQFDKMVKENKIIAPREYHVATGEVWKYGIEKGFENEYEIPVVVTDVQGIKDLKKEFGAHNIIVFYKEISTILQLKRAMSRKENSRDEQIRRIISDDEDFKHIWEWSDYILDDEESNISDDAGFMLNQVDYEIDQFNDPDRDIYI